MNKIELVYYANVNNLEGPIWDEKRNAIWCVGIEEGCVFCIHESGCLKKKYDVGSQVGCIALKEDSFLAATHKGIFDVNIETGKMIFLDQILPNDTIRYNDGKLDPVGRFILGTTGYNRLAEKENYLFSWDEKNTKILVENTTISNGIAFSADKKYMYFVDSPEKKIFRYKYDIINGNIEYIDAPISIIGNGMPDGICMTLDGYLWVAEWGGSRVCKWDTEGTLIEIVELPVKNVSSCCIGGKNKDILYITTAKHDDGTPSEELASGLFKYEPLSVKFVH